ncbi:YT521-B-like domain-containing protein [Russula dissimulans]|nr:YT521-B-like domain-containing protein [Russula dissimulans]
MHIRWIEEQRERTRAGGKGGISLGLADAIQKSLSPFSLSDDEERSTTSCSNRSDSFGSTNSSVLARYFPQRYFILKSRTQSDLDLSVERSAWATQQHNEEILDQAYRTSKDVFIVFGANKSGEFYGYARMAGPILQSEDQVHWASRSTSPASLGQSLDVTGKTPRNHAVPVSSSTCRSKPTCSSVHTDASDLGADVLV